MDKVTTNFGQINGQRIVTFSKSLGSDKVLPKKWKCFDNCDDRPIAFREGLFITAHEAFRRWKIARKAWRARKNHNQTLLSL